MVKSCQLNNTLLLTPVNFILVMNYYFTAKTIGNVLVQLPWNIFGTINEYPKLRVIDMSNNHINEIRGKTENNAFFEFLSFLHCVRNVIMKPVISGVNPYS